MLIPSPPSTDMEPMLASDLAGAALSLLSWGLLGAGGFGAALLLLGDEAERQPLALAIGALLAATAQATAIALLLGAFGWLRIGPALALQALLVAGLLRGRLPWWLSAGRALGQRALAVTRRHPAVAILAAHAAAG